MRTAGCGYPDKRREEVALVIMNHNMGKGCGLDRVGGAAGLMAHIRAVKITCGFHASDLDHPLATVQRAKERGGRIDARPSPPDQQEVGRRELEIGRDDTAICPIRKGGALQGFPHAEDMPLSHVEPRGSLRCMAARNGEVVYAVRSEPDDFGVSIMGIIESCEATVYPSRGHTVIADYYADLGCNGVGLMIITREHHAVNPARAAERCLRRINAGKTTSVEGDNVDVQAVQICIHSDQPNAIAAAEAVALHVNAA